MDNVVLANTVHDPYAMMIVFCNTDVTYTAVLAPCRFQEVAGTTAATRMVQNVVIRVGTHFPVVVLGGDGGRG